MCGRYSLLASDDEIAQVFHTGPVDPESVAMPARYNIAPTQPIAVVRPAISGHSGEREIALVRWGLIPSWVKNPDDFKLIINARSETAAEKPSFRAAMRHRRILVPASGFYEWRRFGKGRKSQPFWVRPADGGLVAFGGLMETWIGPDGSEIDTACILTTAANESFASIHDRLPLVVLPQNHERWLDCKTQEPSDVEDLMKPVADGYFEAIPVGDAVNKVANSGPDIQKRAEPVAESGSKDDSGGHQLPLF